MDAESKRTAEEIIGGYFAELVKTPVKRVYELSDWEEDYYKTPKRMEKARAKAQVQLDKTFAIEMRHYNDLVAAEEKVFSVPKGLMDFFARSLEGWIEGCRRNRAALTEVVNAFREKWNHEVDYTYHADRPNEKDCTFTVNPADSAYEIVSRWWAWESPRYSCEYTEKALDGHLKDAAEVSHYDRERFNGFAPTDAEKEAFCREYIQRRIAEHTLMTTATMKEIFVRTLLRLGEIVDAMKDVLGGLPDGYEHCSNWGVGGHYNGIVSRNGQRAKFTSFYAGGWNIQRLHIRFKVTLLKNN